MTASTALSRGIALVAKAPMILLGVYAATLAMALPVGLALRTQIADHLGGSLEAEAALDGVNWGWWQEFTAQATDLGRTFSPSILGFAAVLDNLSGLLDRQGPPLVLVSVIGAYLGVWIFLSGGIVDRYARNRATRGFGFFGACGTFFFRFLRLTLMAAVGYWVLFRFVHDWLFDDVYVWATRDFTVERTAFGVRMSLYLLFVILLSFYNVLIDYARIRAVVEDRRSMIGALAAGLRFVRNRPTSAIGLYAANGAILLSIVAVYGLLAPGAGGAGPAVWAVFLGTQAYIVARLASKLLFYASQTALFQSEFAVAGYVVAASPGPPEPPAAEAIGTPDEASVQGVPGPTQW